MTTTHGLDKQLCFALYTASRTVTNAYRKGLGTLGLTYPQFVTLLALWEADGPSVSRLGERLYLDSGTLSPLLKRLDALGLVERRRAHDDERRVHVHLTPAGRALKGPALQVQREVASQLGVSAEESVSLRTLARRISSGAAALT